jgi:hypothetical protein
MDWNHDMLRLISGITLFVAMYGSTAFAQDAGATIKAQTHSLFVPLPPHQQPRQADAPDTAFQPTAKEKALDSKINNICRGC